MIRWKVVKGRTSCIVGLNSKKYVLTYKKGKMVEALSFTLGIFCFETKRDAEVFREGRCEILKVKTYGREQKPLTVVFAGWNDRELDNFYNGMVVEKRKVPKGTICYQKVKVLQ